MPGFGLEVIEHNGYRERTVVTASDWDELAEKIAAKTGVTVDSEDVQKLTDGGKRPGGDD
jgi:hypothetical protein